jgi:hypothetical protein
MQVGKGGLPPLKIQFHSTLTLLNLERGQATLPNLHFLNLELFLFRFQPLIMRAAISFNNFAQTVPVT